VRVEVSANERDECNCTVVSDASATGTAPGMAPLSSTKIHTVMQKGKVTAGTPRGASD
jgi:hypothetical protein